MRVVAMVSGGKDSCYNMMQCVAEGHEIVALANLHPKDKGKLINNNVYNFNKIIDIIQFKQSFFFSLFGCYCCDGSL